MIPVLQTLVYPDVTTDYIVDVTGSYALCHDFDTVQIIVVPNLVGTAGNDTSVCPGSPVQLWAPVERFIVDSSLYVDDSSNASPTVSPFVTTHHCVTLLIFMVVSTQNMF
jgi:hypothetical protein